MRDGSHIGKVLITDKNREAVKVPVQLHISQTLCRP